MLFCKLKIMMNIGKKLECGARAYYEKWLAPDVVIKRIIEKAQQN